MVRKNQTFRDGVCIRCESIDYEGDTFTLEVDGAVVETRALTPEERQLYGPQPLDEIGVLATLLAVTGTLTEIDAANAVGLQPDDLVEEALAWRKMIK